MLVSLVMLCTISIAPSTALAGADQASAQAAATCDDLVKPNRPKPADEQARRQWAEYAAQLVALGCPSPTTLPVKEDGTSVTWQEVRQYIDVNFTGSKVFADAVYNAIYASEQNYTKTRAHNAADVIKYFGSPNSNGLITIAEPLEDNAVLTGILLLTRTADLTIEDVGSWKSLGFIEDAYQEVQTKPFPDDKDLGPAVTVRAIGLSELPKNPYQLNLTRTLGMDNHNFQTTAYNDLPVTLLRHSGSGSTEIAIDTTLTGRAAKVDLSSVAASRGSDNAIHPTELESYFRNDLTGQAEETDRISTSGNIVTISVPNDGQDGRYDERIAFQSMYVHYANTVKTYTSIDYFYRASVTYLNTVKIESNDTVLSDLSFQKVDATTGKPIPGVRFKVCADKECTQTAQQAAVKDGKVQLGQDGSIAMQDTETYATDSDGKITVPYMRAGTYYVQEVSAPSGYQLDSKPKRVEVVANPTVTDADVLNGEGKSAEVLKDKNTAAADNFMNARNWEVAEGNIRLTSKKQKNTVDHGAYIKNGGSSITLTDATVTGDGVRPLGGSSTYTMTTSDGAVKTFGSLAEVQSAINALISGNQLDASNAVITVNTGNHVYYAPSDTSTATQQVTNTKLPVYIQPAVTKVLSGDAVLGAGESKTFTFKLSGEGQDQTATVKLSKTGKDAVTGTATFDALKFGADALGKDANGQPVTDKTFTYMITEVPNPADPDVTYNTEGASYRMTVRVTALDGSGGKGYGYQAAVTVHKVTTDGSGTEQSAQVFSQTFTSADTNTASTDAQGNVTYTPKPGKVEHQGFQFVNSVIAKQGSFGFSKRDGDDVTSRLPGATFRLYQCVAGAGQCGTGTSESDLIDVDNPPVGWAKVGEDVTSGADGSVEFTDLTLPGEYRLVEVKAPQGYAKPTGQWRVTFGDDPMADPTIEAVGEAPAFRFVSADGSVTDAASSAGVSSSGPGAVTAVRPAVAGGSSAAGSSDGDVALAATSSSLVLPNYTVITVPSAGGRGFWMFALTGGGLLLAGVTVLSIKRGRRCH